MFLGEQVRAFRLSMVALGMAGVPVCAFAAVCTVDPANGRHGRGTLGRRGGPAGGPSAPRSRQVFVRKMVQTESTAAIVFILFTSRQAPMSLLTAADGGWADAAAGLGAGDVDPRGSAGGVGQILLTSSYRFADASLIAPFEYA